MYFAQLNLEGAANACIYALEVRFHPTRKRRGFSRSL